MDVMIDLDTIYVPSEDVIIRDMEKGLLIIPLVSEIGDAEDEVFTLNEIGRAIWNKIDGKKNLKVVVEELLMEFEDPDKEIEGDVIQLIERLLRMKVLTEVKVV